ncbi:MAG: LysM peptidoglycan-binding domain-containing protein [Anaerolineae bacterium]|nr:LysM peptidoglycan-binding domain-containing protein [Anaerolineae bacterium]
MRVLIASLVVMFGLFVTIAWFTLHHLGNTILPGVYVQTVAVGGLTVDEATVALARVLPAPETLGVNVLVAGQTWPLSWADVGQHYDARATAQAAYQVGRNVEGKPSLWMRVRDQNVVIEPILVSADPVLVTAYVAQIAETVDRSPVDAHFALEEGAIIATAGQPGKCLDLQTSVTYVLQALTEDIPSLDLSLLPVSPRIAEPEPARTQAQAWLAQPFTLVVPASLPDALPENESDSSETVEFTALPESVSTWLEPRIEGQGIALHVVTASIEIWLEELAPQLETAQLLAVAETAQNVFDALYAGQHRAEAQLRLPNSVYIVQPGDTLLDIALDFRTTVRAIKAANDLDSDLIIAGQELLIPSTFTPEVLSETVVSDTPALIDDTPPLVVDVPADGVVPDFPASHSVNWRGDLAAMVERINRLPEIYPGGFRVVYDEAFTQAVTALDAAIPTLADHQIVVGMMQILALLGDAHTGVSVYQWAAFQERAYPIQLRWFSDGLFVTAVQPGYEELLGLELVQVGGMSISQVLERLARIIPHENTYRLRAASTDYIIRPVILHALGLTGELTSASFVFQNEQGRNLTRSLAADASSAMQDRWIQAVSFQSAPLYLQKSQDTYYWYTYIESAQALYFQFNYCVEYSEIYFGKFLEQISNVIATRPVQKYIIDLRRNPGGLPGLPDLVLEHLKAYPHLTQSGKLLVLTGNQTYSAAVYLTSLLQQQFNATLIGEPTGQGNNFYATPLRFALPNSSLVIAYSSEYWEFAEVSSMTLEPDIWVTLSSADYFAGYDPVLSSALAQP